MQNDPKNTLVTEEALRRRHESAPPRLRNVLVSVVAVVVMTVACYGVVQAMMKAFASKRPMTMRPAGDIVAPNLKPLEITSAPHLQVDEHADLNAFRAREDDDLGSYGWIDRTGGVVRIPVERAMDIIAAHGLPGSTNVATRSDPELIQERSQNR